MNMNDLHPVDQLIRDTLHRAGFHDTSAAVVTEVLADLEREEISLDTFVALPAPQLYALVHAMKWSRRFSINHDPDAVAIGQTPWFERDGPRLWIVGTAVASFGTLWHLLAGNYDDAIAFLAG